mmetsp:Transcript_29495/g.96048  ORF Transcript_29495/g.96048 Transcript_29495/m.96048 type:complete len:217 (-) Transcript_29495:34-684(-)
MLVSSVSTAVPVEGSDLSPPGRTMTQSMPEELLSASSAFTFSRRTGSSTSYTCGGGAPLLSPVPMLVTSTNFCTPFFAAASMSAMFPSLSARGSAGVPPIVLTTTSSSSSWSNTRVTSSGTSASPLASIAPQPSSSFWYVVDRCMAVTHAPASLSSFATCSATPPPPHTRTEMLSGSRSARAADAADVRAARAVRRPSRPARPAYVAPEVRRVAAI